MRRWTKYETRWRKHLPTFTSMYKERGEEKKEREKRELINTPRDMTNGIDSSCRIKLWKIHLSGNGYSWYTNRMFRIRTVFRRCEFFDDCVMWIVLWRHVRKSSNYAADRLYDTISVDDTTVEMWTFDGTARMCTAFHLSEKMTQWRLNIKKTRHTHSGMPVVASVSEKCHKTYRIHCV